MIFITISLLQYANDKIAILDQWKIFQYQYFIMTRIARDVLNAIFAKIANERFFFIVNRIYESHKYFNLEIIKVKIIVRQYDQYEHVRKRKRVSIANLNCYLALKKVYVQNKSQKEKKKFCKKNSSLKYFSILFE